MNAPPQAAAIHPVSDSAGAPLDARRFRRAAGVSRETLDRLVAYADCLLRWRPRVNLASRRSLDDLWRRHMLDSAQLAAHLPPGAARLTDLGSGAGFPGLVLAVIAGVETRLVEADSRKAAFLEECIRLTGAPARVYAERIERLDAWPSDVVTARALAPLPRLLDYARPFLRPVALAASCCLFPKGAAWREELTAARRLWRMRVEIRPSATEPAARILRLERVARRAPGETGEIGEPAGRAFHVKQR